MSPTPRNRALLAAAVAAVLTFGAIAPVAAQSPLERQRAERQKRQKPAQEDKASAAQIYPQATREEPTPELSRTMSKALEAMTALSQEGKAAEARAAADEVIADAKAGDYAKAYAAQIAGQIAYSGGDSDAAAKYYAQAVALDSLDNNAHYNAMFNLAQLQQSNGLVAEALATFERFLKETNSQDPAHLVMKGQSLYLLERYPEAITVLKQAIDASAEPKPEWQALLMQAYASSGQGASAVQAAEQVAAAKPDDKRAQMNLAILYQQADMPEKAIAVLEKLRAAGKLTEAPEYQQLFVTHLNMEGHEAQAIEIIQEGLKKGILQPDFNTQVALAQSYYFSGQTGPAIEAYQKAAPLDDDGSTYLNLAKILLNEGRKDEARAAAEQAQAKGLEQPDQATSIIQSAGG
ncbi:MAG: tetratricopeptide repeat protein [Lysobacter sp.]